jgi:hypothetical protein
MTAHHPTQNWDKNCPECQKYQDYIHEQNKMLQEAQDELNKLIAMNKEPTKLMAIPEIMESAGWVRKKKWVGLTDEEIKDIVWNMPYEPGQDEIRAIEAKLKERNT